MSGGQRYDRARLAGLPSAARGAAEIALNQYLGADERALARAAALAGRSLSIGLTDLGIAITFVAERHGVQIVGQPEDEPGPAVPRPPAERAAGPAHGGARAAPAADVRVYSVWHVPGHPEATGIWVGPHPACWEAICALLRDHQYAGSGANLRRYANVEEAQAAWVLAAPRSHRPTSTPATVFEVV